MAITPQWMKLVALATLTAMAGCAAGENRTVVVEQMSGNVRIDLDDASPDRLRVTFGDRTGAFAYDFNVAADREALIRGMMTEQCGIPVIERTRVTTTGTYSGRRYLFYTVDVRCPKGASRVAE